MHELPPKTQIPEVSKPFQISPQTLQLATILGANPTENQNLENSDSNENLAGWGGENNYPKTASYVHYACFNNPENFVGNERNRLRFCIVSNFDNQCKDNETNRPYMTIDGRKYNIDRYAVLGGQGGIVVANGVIYLTADLQELIVKL